MCMISFKSLGFVRSVCSTHVAMVKTKAYSSFCPGEGVFPLPSLCHTDTEISHHSHDIYEVLTVHPLFSPEECVIFTIFIPCLITEVEQCLILCGVTSSLRPRSSYLISMWAGESVEERREGGPGAEIGETFCVIS